MITATESNTKAEFDGLDTEELLQSYQHYATEESKIERAILALQAEALEARAMKEQFFIELMRRGDDG